MQVRLYEDVLICADAQGLRRYVIDAQGTPRLEGSLSAPAHLWPYAPMPLGQRLSTVTPAGMFARQRDLAPRSPRGERRSSVEVYDVALTCVASFEVEAALEPLSLALSPDGRSVASVSHGEGARLYEGQSGALIASVPGHMASGVSWSPDGRYVAMGDSGQAGGALYLLDVQAPDGPQRLSLPKPSSKAPLYDSPYTSAFSGGGALVVFSCAAWGTRGLTLYEVGTLSERWAISFAMDDEDGEEEELWDALEVSFACGGAVVLAGVEAGQLLAFGAEDGAALEPLLIPAASSFFFAADDARGVVWVCTTEGSPTGLPYPESWLVVR